MCSLLNGRPREGPDHRLCEVAGARVVGVGVMGITGLLLPAGDTVGGWVGIEGGDRSSAPTSPCDDGREMDGERKLSP